MKQYHLFKYANDKSLAEINGTVSVPKNKGFWRTLLAYSGPGALVAVGYMDPGNWATSINGGQSFQFTLISTILISSLMAMLLQNMSAKLGIVTQLDLAQAIRLHTDKVLSIILWIIAELAIMATDIAEVIGAAIALNLLFHIPLILATFITVLDVLMLLFLSKIGFRKIEILVSCLILVILFVFAYEVILAHPSWTSIGLGFLPSSKMLAKTPVVGGISPLSGSLGIIGATVMPHNFYLHSGISQIRKVDRNDPKSIRQAVRFTEWDSNIQLTIAFIINSLLLVMGAAVFKSGAVQDSSFFGLYAALNNISMLSNPLLISVAKTGVLSTLFAVALLASGQNSTITGTLTGQIVMEGFIHLHMPLWARRLLTRLISVIPVLICVSLTANASVAEQHFALNMLMENSQVFLAFAVPFTIIPLLILTDSKKLMGEFANSRIFSVLGWSSSLILVFLNLYNLPETFVSFDIVDPAIATNFAYAVIALILILLGWTCAEMLDLDFRHLKPSLNY
jgi:manganese transport protein